MVINGINLVETREIILSAFCNSVVCLESALVENRTTSYLDRRPCIYYSGNEVLSSQFIILVPNLFGVKDIIGDDKRRFSSIERTICEMILFDRREDMIIEALDEYINWEGCDPNAINVIKAKAKEYGVLDKIDELIEATNDLYNY